MINIKKLEAELWESADLLRQGSKLTSQEYCMPVLGLIFLRYAYSRFKYVEKEILTAGDRPIRNGQVLPVEGNDFKAKSALFLPEQARYEYLMNLPDNADVGKAVNEAMELIEKQSAQLLGVLPKTYMAFQNDLLRELLRIFNNKTLDEISGDVIGRIYEYFLSKFAPAVASDDGVFFTPKSLVQMIVNIIEPERGILLDPACGSGGMFVQTGDFVSANGINANTAMTFYGQEKVDYNSKLCLMNMAVHGLNGNIKSGDEANTFYNDAHHLEGQCDYVMANPPFNVDKVKSESAQNAGRLPFGLSGVNKNKEFSNANYLWISYFYSYLNEHGRAGFVMAASATDSGNKDRDIRQKLIDTGHVDVMLSVGNNFFYTKSLPCTLWFFDKGKPEERQDKVLFIDARNYYTVIDRTTNEWSEWQMKNLNAIVWLYRGETEKYTALLNVYALYIEEEIRAVLKAALEAAYFMDDAHAKPFINAVDNLQADWQAARKLEDYYALREELKKLSALAGEQLKAWTAYGDDLGKDEVKAMMQAILDSGRGGPLPENGRTRTWAQFKKLASARVDAFTEVAKALRTVIKEARWLTEKFGSGVYADVPGLCKLASRAEIEEKNWSLTPGAYVGVVAQEEDEEDFAQRMREIHAELRELQDESNRLMETISKNFEEMEI